MKGESDMANEIVLGSGVLYAMAFTGTLPTDEALEATANELGKIKGGASVEYKPTEYEVKDDLGTVQRRFITSEEVTMKSGILTWNAETLSKLVAKGTYNDNSTTHVRTLKIGGLGAREMDKYVLRFVHTDGEGHKFRATIVGTASNGMTLAFAPDKETVVDATFKAMGHDADGTQLILSEEYEAA